MAGTRILSQDITDKNVTSAKLEDNISISQSLMVGTSATIGTSLGVVGAGTFGTTLGVGTNLTVGGLIQNITDTLAFFSGVGNSPTAVAFDLNTDNLINQLGSLLVNIRNNDSSVFTIDGYGNITSSGGIIEATSQALLFKDAYTGATIPLSDSINYSLPLGEVSILSAIANAGSVTDLDSGYDGETGGGAGRSIIADSGPVSIQRNFAGSPDPLLEIGDGYTLNHFEVQADGVITGGSSPFRIRSRESDTIAGKAFQLEAIELLGPGADLLRLINDADSSSVDVLRIKADGDHDFGSGLAPRFTATPPVTGGDDTAFTFNTLAPNFDDSIIKMEHGGVEKFALDGYGNLNFQGTDLQIGVRDGYARIFSDLSDVIFRNSSGEYITASGANLSLSSPLSNQNEIILDGAGGNKISFISGVVDGPAAEGFVFDTRNALETPGSKLTQWKVAGSEVASVDGYGTGEFNAIDIQSGLVSSSSTLQFQDANAISPIPFSDVSNITLPIGVDSLLDGINQASSLANLSILDSYTVNADITVPGGQNFVVLGSALQLPIDLAADANGTGDGAVASFSIIMGAHSVAHNNLSNKVAIRDADTNDPIFDGYGQQIFGLLQTEITVEGTAFDVSPPDRVQISFVKENPISEVIESADISSVEGKIIEYTYNRRVKLIDATEGALSGGLMINAIPDSLDNSYDGYEDPGSGRHIFADSGPVHIVVPDGYNNDAFEITRSDIGDGYSLKINSNSDSPSIYIDQVAGPSVAFAKDNQNDIGRPLANRPRSVYVGTQVAIGDSILIDTNTISGTAGVTVEAQAGNLILQTPGNNTVDAIETPSLGIEITGERTIVSPYEKPLFSIDNFGNTVLRVDGYGSLYLGDTTDGYGLDASRIVFNANRFDQPEDPNDAYNAGLVVERGSAANQAKLYWNEESDRWEEDKGDTVARHITSFEKTISSSNNPISQDSISFSESIKQAWQRALIHNIVVTTDSPDYNVEIYKDSSFARKIFQVNHIVGNLDAQTSLYYKDLDGYNELHYKITNNDIVAHFFTLSLDAEVFFDGYTRPGVLFTESFEGGGAFSGLVFGNLLDENFDDTFFDAGGTGLLTVPFDDTFFDAGGTGLLTEDFDSYGIFDAYAGVILDSDDMNSLGF